MLLLPTTSHKLQLVTASTANIDVYACWMDNAAGVITGSSLNSKISTITTTDIVGAPGASVLRNVKTLHAQNVHASAANTVIVQVTDGTNVVNIESFSLAAGERMAYVEGVGFRYFDASGLEKINPTVVAGQLTTTRLGADVSNATVTAAKITGLDTVVGVGTWIFEYFLIFQSSLATTGPKLSVNHTGTVGSFLTLAQFLTSLTTDSLGAIDQDALVPQVMGGMAKRVKDATATMIMTGGVDTISVDTLIQISGLAVVTASGNMELWHASETANSTTIKANSSLRLTKVA